MVTAQISLPGRYLVLTPGNTVNGISRKIESREEREHFRQLVDGLDVPDNTGVIVRTASLGVTQEDFGRDLENLLDTHKEVQAIYKKLASPGLVWQEDDVVTRTLRDTWVPDIEEVHIDDLDTFKSAQNFFRRTMPQHLRVLHHYNGKKPIFSKFQTEEQIDRIYSRCVPLPSGGAIVLDQTEALVAIDVNSGKTTGDNQEDTATRTNLEAAEAIAAQLRLRDLAGLIVIDFIDMRRETNNKAVMERLVECLRVDKARMEVGKINRFGVLVMTRQRIRPSIQHVTHETCHVCQGTGKVKNLEALVLSVLRRLKSVLSRNGVVKIQVRISPLIAINLLNQRRSELNELEISHDVALVITPDHDISYGEVSMEIFRQDEEQDQPKHHEAHDKRTREAEDETVVLDGDAPISFGKALSRPDEKNQTKGDSSKKGSIRAQKQGKERSGEADIPKQAAQNTPNDLDRRVAQRAALAERERLRTLFEAPKNMPPTPPSKTDASTKPGSDKASDKAVDKANVTQKGKMPVAKALGSERQAKTVSPRSSAPSAKATMTASGKAQVQPSTKKGTAKAKGATEEQVAKTTKSTGSVAAKAGTTRVQATAKTSTAKKMKADTAKVGDKQTKSTKPASVVSKASSATKKTPPNALKKRPA
jgi:ribonuclease E